MIKGIYEQQKADRLVRAGCDYPKRKSFSQADSYDTHRALCIILHIIAGLLSVDVRLPAHNSYVRASYVSYRKLTGL